MSKVVVLQILNFSGVKDGVGELFSFARIALAVDFEFRSFGDGFGCGHVHFWSEIHFGLTGSTRLFDEVVALAVFFFQSNLPVADHWKVKVPFNSIGLEIDVDCFVDGAGDASVAFACSA